MAEGNPERGKTGGLQLEKKEVHFNMLTASEIEKMEQIINQALN